MLDKILGIDDMDDTVQPQDSQPNVLEDASYPSEDGEAEQVYSNDLSQSAAGTDDVPLENPTDNPEADELAEAAVPAEQGELEREASADASETPAQSTAPQHRSNASGGSERPLDMTGVQSEDLIQQDANEVSAEEKIGQTIRDLDRYRRSGAILWGTLYGIEESGIKNSNRFYINVWWNDVKINIPDNEFFEDEFYFGDTYAQANEKQKLERRMQMARYQLGSRVPFCVVGITRTPITEGDFAGQIIYAAGASRRQAMAKLRDMWFFHKNRRSETRTPREVKVGDYAIANVLAVRDDQVLCECLGCETRLSAYNLTSEKFVDNCEDFVKPGQKLKVRIRRLHINGANATDEDGRKLPPVYLGITGRLNNTSNTIKTMKKDSRYLGIVDGYNRQRNVYTIILFNHVMAAVSGANVMDGVQLTVGDRVDVRVTRLMDDFVYGVAKKL